MLSEEDGIYNKLERNKDYRELIENMIHSKSGIQLRLKCADMMRRQGHEEPTGQAKITPAYNLPCEYVIHTVGRLCKGN